MGEVEATAETPHLTFLFGEPMPEKYNECILIRCDGAPPVLTPSFVDTDVDVVFEFEGTIKLVQILKSIQNAVHNKHDYVFKIVNITKIQKES